MPTQPTDVSLCLYPEGITSVVESCFLQPVVGASSFQFGPTPQQMDGTSFRALFSDPSITRLRSYTCTQSSDGGRVLMNVESFSSDLQPCTVTYETGGLSWQVWYDCVLRHGRAILTAYLSVTNATSVPYDDVTIRFVVSVGPSQAPSRHAFSTERPVSLHPLAMTHIELFTAAEIPVFNRIVAPADSPVVIEEFYLQNSDRCGLGMELPPGPIRVFQDGPPLLRIDAGTFPFTMPGDEISVRSVVCPDVVLHGGWDYDTGIANVHVHNGRAESVSVQVEETEDPVDIVEASHQLQADGSFRYFLVEVAPSSTSRLSYRISDESLRRSLPPGYQRPPRPALSMQPVGSHLPNPHLA